MSELRPVVAIFAGALALGCAQAALGATAAERQLLAATDPFAKAPGEMRIELVFSAGVSKPGEPIGTGAAAGARVPIELWRKGDDRALVRFLAPKDFGKFVVRRDGAFWFLSPGAKRPVKLAPALAPSGGAALDELLAVHPARDYAIAAVSDQGPLTTFDLTANEGAGGPPKVRWVVDRERRLPVRAEFRSADDRVTRLIEFKRWRDAAKLVPETLVAKDVARGGLPLEVEFGSIEARPVPDALFDLSDPSARQALPPAPSPAAR